MNLESRSTQYDSLSEKMFGSVILLAAIGSSCKAPLGGVWSEAESGSKDGCVKQAAALGSQCCVSTPPSKCKYKTETFTNVSSGT